MNIVGEYATYINSILSQFVPATSDELRGIINNGTLYFIVNFGLLYEIELPNIPKEICCAFHRTTDEPDSFNEEGIIKDRPEYFANIVNSIMIINYSNNVPVYIEENVRLNEQYEELDAMKADDGCMKFNTYTDLSHRSFITISKKMFKMNKPDGLSLIVYPADNGRLLYKFKIFKKKFNLNINLYLLAIDVY